MDLLNSAISSILLLQYSEKIQTELNYNIVSKTNDNILWSELCIESTLKLSLDVDSEHNLLANRSNFVSISTLSDEFYL